MPAVKPGPTPTTTGAMSQRVPTLRFARMASTTTSGASSRAHVHAGSTSTGTSRPAARTAAASPALATRTARTPSTWASPSRTASLNATVRRTVKGCAISVMTTRMPQRCRRSAMALAISPAPLITASTQTHPFASFPPPRAWPQAAPRAAPAATPRRFRPC